MSLGLSLCFAFVDVSKKLNDPFFRTSVILLFLLDAFGCFWYYSVALKETLWLVGDFPSTSSQSKAC